MHNYKHQDHYDKGKYEAYNPPGRASFRIRFMVCSFMAGTPTRGLLNVLLTMVSMDRYFVFTHLNDLLLVFLSETGQDIYINSCAKASKVFLHNVVYLYFCCYIEYPGESQTGQEPKIVGL